MASRIQSHSQYSIPILNQILIPIPFTSIAVNGYFIDGDGDGVAHGVSNFADDPEEVPVVVAQEGGNRC